MSLKHAQAWNPEFERRLRSAEVVTVRCARCSWTYTGPALHISRRGNENGALARGRKHAASCARWQASKRAYDDRNREQKRARERERMRARRADPELRELELERVRQSRRRRRAA